MPLINKEKLIGWYNESGNRFLCDKCFSKEKDSIKESDYKSVIEDELRDEDLFICDVCGERFEGPF